MNLLLNALLKFLSGFLLVFLLLFLSAGTVFWFNGWLFMGLLFLPMFILGLVLLIKAPDLLKKRLDGNEEDSAQKGVVFLSGLAFLAGFILSGLDFRFGWSSVPDGCVIAASVLFVITYAFYAEVMRENAYLSRTVKVQDGQQVVDSGLYGIVRHPMYAVTVILFLCIPVVLGSWYALIVFAHYPILVVVRILNEEKVLVRDLPGYREYQNRVRYRLLPLIW